MPKGVPHKRYTAEFKKHVVETMHEEGLSYREADRRFDLPNRRSAKWERIYLEEGPGGFEVERRGRGSTGRPKKLPKEVEEDLLAEVQRLRAENEYLKNLQALVWKTSDASEKNAGSSKAKAKIFLGYTSFNRSIAPGNLLLPLEEKQQTR